MKEDEIQKEVKRVFMKFDDMEIINNTHSSSPIKCCSSCKKVFVVGEKIYRVVEQDYISGVKANPKKQNNVAKFCEECWNKLIRDVGGEGK